MEPWFSTRMSGEGRRLVSRQVGLDPDASNAFFMVSPFVQEKAVRRIDLGERLRWVFAPLAVSLQILEAGTVTFSLARLPRR
jgi:hypothetical protein